jgi:hypothetical protein
MDNANQKEWEANIAFSIAAAERIVREAEATLARCRDLQETLDRELRLEEHLSPAQWAEAQKKAQELFQADMAAIEEAVRAKQQEQRRAKLGAAPRLARGLV